MLIYIYIQSYYLYTHIYLILYTYVGMHICINRCKKKIYIDGWGTNSNAIARSGVGVGVIENTGLTPLTWPKNHISRRHVHRYISIHTDGPCMNKTTTIFGVSREKTKGTGVRSPASLTDRLNTQITHTFSTINKISSHRHSYWSFL
jgi:hypothetical protein